MTAFNKKGFTLIEVILTLAISGVLAVMVSSFLSSSLTSSSDPLIRLRKTLDIYSVMEHIQTNYEYSDQSLSDLKTGTDLSIATNPHSITYGTDTINFNVTYNDFVDCDATDTSAPIVCTGSSGTTTLMLKISDVEIPGVSVSRLFTD